MQAVARDEKIGASVGKINRGTVTVRGMRRSVVMVGGANMADD